MPFLGTIQPSLKRDEQVFVHGQGWSRVIEYSGGKNEINGLLAGLADQGWEVRIEDEGPYRRLIGTMQCLADDPNDYYDRFTFTKEIIQKDLWTLEAVHTHQPTTNFSWDSYKKLIEDAIDLGDEDIMVKNFGAYDAVIPATPAWCIYLELLRGAHEYEDEYLVLTRERVIGFNYGGELLAIPQANNSLIYTTNQLKTVFNIPNFVGVEWPVDPAKTPTNCKWGWRNRRREVRFQEGQRIELVQDWAYAAWSLFAYNTYA